MAAAPAQSKAADRAKANRVPYGKLLTTTPSTLDDPAGAYLFEMLNQSIDFNEDWYDMDINEVKTIIEEGSKNDFVHIEYSYQQLGKDEKWFIKQCKALAWDMFKIKREVKLEWMFASNDSPFSEEQLDAISKCIKDPVGKITIFGKYVFDVITPISNIYKKSWIVAVDVATGLSKDSSAITVIDPLTYKPVIVFNNNTIDIPELALVIEELVYTYLPNAVIVPERNTIGIPLINLLERSKVAKNLYYEIQMKEAQTTVETSGGLSSSHKTKKETRVYGMLTDNNNRKIMTEEILFDIVNNHPDYINNARMFSEVKTLVRESSGRINHKPGKHDDQLMSYLIGLNMLFNGNATSRFIKVISDKPDQTVSSSTRVINNIQNIQKNTKKLQEDKFKVTKELMKKYEKMQAESQIDRNSAEYGEPIPVLSQDMVSTTKFDQQSSKKKKVSKSTLNMLSSFNKRR